MTSPEAELRRTWHRIAGRGHDAVLDEVLARHREPHRRYHSAVHVMWVCRHVDRLIAAGGTAIPAIESDTIRAAALFHDAVYDPRATDNERASARLADIRLADVGWADDRRAEVQRLIELTAGHEVDSHDVSGTVLLDADLAILGAEANEYRHYATGVRTEYAHVDDTGWREGRAKVLRHFLDRDAIFLTETMHAERESRARANLTAELAALRG